VSGRGARLAGTLGAIGSLLALLVLTLCAILLLAGFPVGPSLAALWDGAFGSWHSLGSGTFVRATPLILTGLAVTLAFKAGVWNIGAEGQLLAGAAAVAAVALLIPELSPALAIPLLVLVGGVAGAVWAGIAATLKWRFAVLEVISTIMLNFLAIYLVGYLIRGPLQEPLHIYPQSAEIAEVLRIPALMAGTRLTWAFPTALALAGLLWWVLGRTAAGFRIRVVGANPIAAASAARIAVGATTFRAFLLSGALAGFAGAFEILSVTGALYENLSPGYGYTAIAVALLARLNPVAVISSAVLFGALEAGAASMQRDAGVPSVVVWVVEAVLLLAVLLLDRVQSRSRGVATATDTEPVASVA
jgi:general nucleoside transport system permease protein